MIINTVNFQDGPVASGKLANNTNLTFSPAGALGIHLSLGGVNYKDKYFFGGFYTVGRIIRLNDLNDLTNYTSVDLGEGSNSTLSIADVGIPGKIYVPLSPYNQSSLRLALYEVDAESLAFTKVIDTTLAPLGATSYVYWLSIASDGTYMYIADNGPTCRIFKYDIATWTLQSTYTSAVASRMGSISYVNGYLYGITYQVVVGANNHIVKIDPSTMSAVQLIDFGPYTTANNYPFGSPPWFTAPGGIKKNMIAIGNKLYVAYGRSTTSSYSFYSFDINDLSQYQVINIPSFSMTGINNVSLFAVDTQLFLYNHSNYKICQYDTTTNSVVFIRTMPINPTLSANSTICPSNDIRVSYFNTLGGLAAGGKYTKQRH